MLLVSPDGGPEQARVLRLADDGVATPGALVLTALGVGGAKGR